MFRLYFPATNNNTLLAFVLCIGNSQTHTGTIHGSNHKKWNADIFAIFSVIWWFMSPQRIRCVSHTFTKTQRHCQMTKWNRIHLELSFLLLESKHETRYPIRHLRHFVIFCLVSSVLSSRELSSVDRWVFRANLKSRERNKRTISFLHSNEEERFCFGSHSPAWIVAFTWFIALTVDRMPMYF